MNEPAAGTPRTTFGRIAVFVLHHRRWVMIAWLLITIAGVVGVGRVQSRLSVDFSLPGQPGYDTAKQLSQVYGANGTLGFTSIGVLTPPSGHTAVGETASLGAAAAAIEHSIPGARVVDYANTHDTRFIGSNHRTSVAIIFSPPPTSFSSDPTHTITRDLSSSLPGWQTGVTGLNQLSSGGSTSGPGVLAETLIGSAGALVVLAFVFASLLALLPMLVAAVSILTTFLVVLALTEFTEVSFVVEFLVALVGLGLAIDYSLLLVTRWREERERGVPNHEAVIRAVETAGRTVAVSGLTVAIGLLSLIVLPVPGLRSVGIGGVLIPVVSTIVVLTLLPALLGGIGPRADWPRIRHEANASRVWTRWAQLVVNRRWIGAGVALVALALFLSPVFGLKVGQTSVAALAQTGPRTTPTCR
jgi:putative drug exporter of the RND superfamily